MKKKPNPNQGSLFDEASDIGLELRNRFPNKFKRMHGLWDSLDGRSFIFQLKVEFPTLYNAFARLNPAGWRTNNQLMWHLMNPGKIPRCLNCGSTPNFGANRSNKRMYAQFCSNLCAMSSDKIRAMRVKFWGDMPSDQWESVISQRKATCIERFGVDNPLKAACVQQKVETTSYARYGTRRPSQNPEVLRKIQRSGISYTRMTVGSNILDLQGYEPIVVNDILHNKIFKFLKIRDIYTSSDKLRTIGYERRGLPPPYCRDYRYKYFPDIGFSTKSGSRYIVEVKSRYTLHGRKGWLVSNLNKWRHARLQCQESGETFIVAIAQANGQIDYLWDPSSKTIRDYIRNGYAHESLLN